MSRWRSSKDPLHLRAAQIEIAILEPNLLAGQLLAPRLKRRIDALVEDRHLLAANFDLAGGQLGVDGSLRPRRDLARDGDHEFRPKRTGDLAICVAPFRVKDDLRLAVSVAEIDEQHSLVIAGLIDPAANRHRLPGMSRPQLAASMRSNQFKAPNRLKLANQRSGIEKQHSKRRRYSTTSFAKSFGAGGNCGSIFCSVSWTIRLTIRLRYHL